MADKEISALTAASALDGTEIIHGVQSTNSRKITVAQIATYIQGSVAKVQSAGARLTGSGTFNATLGSTPTVGNILFYIGVGFNGGTWKTLLPTGFTIIQEGSPVSNQYYRVAYRTVQSGDGTSWGYTTSGGANDVGGFVVVEVSGCADLSILAQAAGNSGSVMSSACFDGGTKFFTIVAFERDNTGTYSSISGAALLYDGSGGGVNHPAVFAVSNASFSNAAVTMSSSNTNPIAVQVKIIA